MVEAFLHQRGNHPSHIGGVHTDSVRFMESPVLNTERETHADNEQLCGCSFTEKKRSTQKK